MDSHPSINYQINRSQLKFLQLPNRYCAFVGGFRSGKTWIGCVGICNEMWRRPKTPTAYYAPTYSLIKDIFYPTIERVAHALALKTKIKIADAEVQYYDGSGRYRGMTKCRSMDDPSKIVGSGYGRIVVDESDTMNTAKMFAVWNKIVARLSYRGYGDQWNRIDAPTTPEGFGFAYNTFYKDPKPEYGLVQCPTSENAHNLPAGYTSDLKSRYPEYLIKSYLNGEFTNLTSGTVYRVFSRKTHGSDEVIRDGDALHIGQDFNVGNMSSVVFVQRGNGYHAVDELTGALDVVDLCQILKQRYPKHQITIYPDASGNSRHASDASKTEINMLRSEGLSVLSRNANPRIKDRVLSVNAALEKGLLRVNLGKCKKFVEALEKQCYDNNGEPDKTAGYDHINDAGGYFVYFKIPVSCPLYGSVLS